jgi:hypothetical protein
MPDNSTSSPRFQTSAACTVRTQWFPTASADLAVIHLLRCMPVMINAPPFFFNTGAHHDTATTPNDRGHEAQKPFHQDDRRIHLASQFLCKVASDVASRLRRANGILAIDISKDLADYLHRLSQKQGLQVLSMSVRSQLRRAAKLYWELNSQ